jgi:DnaJ-class molecular chaperone
MENFYNLFKISSNSSITEIMSAYQAQISKYNNLPFINDMQAKKIKELKKGLYILTNPNLKTIYDKKLNGINNEIKCINSIDDNDVNLDTLFSSKTLINPTQLNNNEKLNNNLLGDRIFSLSHMNKVHQLDDFSMEIRKPLTGRLEKEIK